jgi:amino acid permease
MQTDQKELQAQKTYGKTLLRVSYVIALAPFLLFLFVFLSTNDLSSALTLFFLILILVVVLFLAGLANYRHAHNSLKQSNYPAPLQKKSSLSPTEEDIWDKLKKDLGE